MPPKKKGNMEAKILAMDNDLSSLRLAMEEMRLQAEENQAKLIALLTEGQGKKTGPDNGGTVDDGSGERSSQGKSTDSSSPGVRKLQGDALDDFRQSAKKVELPMFNGEDPAGWITRAEVYFRIQESSEEVRVSLAQLCMEGATIHFFNSLLDEEGTLTWEQLKKELLDRYGGLSEGNIFEQLASLQQTGSVEEYIQDFERLIAQVKRLPEEQYFGYFLHGLKEELRGRIRSLQALGPLSRARLMNVTRAVEMEMTGRGSRAVPGWKGDARAGGSSQTSFRSGLHANGSRNAPVSDWVFVKGGREHGPAKSLTEKEGNGGAGRNP